MSTIKSSNEHLTFNADGSGKNILFQANGTQKASISSAGLFTSTTIDATVLTGALPAISGANLTGVTSVGGAVGADFTDNTKLRFGTGNDLEIYHDGSNSFVHDGGDGNLTLRGANLVLGSAAGETYIYCTDNGATSIYHDNAVKLATTAAGVTVTGVVAATTLTGDGSALTGVGVTGISSSANATAITIDATENIGIGVVPEDWHSAYDGGIVQINSHGAIFSQGAETYLTNNVYEPQSGGMKYINTNVATLYSQQTGIHHFKTAVSGSADAAITWIDAMTIKADGNVGIGTTNPQKNLHIFKTEGGVGAKHATIRLGGYSTVGPDIAAYRHTGNSNDQGLIFSTYHNSNGTVDTLTLDSDGNAEFGGIVKADAWESTVANTEQGIQHAKVSWNSASNKTVATFNLGGHSAAAWTMWVTHSDWSDHSGGGRIVSGVMNSGYDSPGSIFTDHMSPNQFSDITFSIGTSSNTRILQVSGGNSNGPNGVHIMMMACSPSSWTLAQS